MHQALEAASERLYEVFEGARFERRSDLIIAFLPGIPIPQFNGAWACEDSDAAVGALADAVAEIEAAGEWPWVQTRSGQERTRQAALAVGLTHTERLPGMVVRPDGFVEADADLDIALIAEDEIEEANRLLSASFEAPVELFERFYNSALQADETRWYVGRAEGAIVSTAVGFTFGGATGIFNVATPSEQRGRGYGAALTSRAVRDGFDSGSEFSYLQSSAIGHSLYRRLGFRDVEEYTLLTRPPPS
jgi:ribosomal protein S18 acetylase RimI-like enzyme